MLTPPAPGYFFHFLGKVLVSKNSINLRPKGKTCYCVDSKRLSHLSVQVKFEKQNWKFYFRLNKIDVN